ncbi:unnamed protein product [Nyctereutes procyonoides]|uniref:(raccoon dog) hypothetical protein n=1 Tax=Nyctereutes procyonoides TaxID=34880 RepID=A0A811Z698_NYCPR|nr:unnamed protein product [Nyctereutes procyonoides]
MSSLYFSLLDSLQQDPPVGVSGMPSINNIMGTPFEDGTFKLVIEFSEEYPNKPLTVGFLSKIPAYDVPSILTSIHPANSQAAQLYQENKREYEKRVSTIV